MELAIEAIDTCFHINLTEMKFSLQNGMEFVQIAVFFGVSVEEVNQMQNLSR